MKKVQYKTLFEDKELIIVDKSAGLLSVPDRYDPERANLYNLLAKQYKAIFKVHRLDRETSGIICFAKTKDTHKKWNEAFTNQLIEKHYQAIVDGILLEKSGFIDQPIAEDLSITGKMKVHPKGKASYTAYQVIEQFDQYAFLDVSPKTGRTHQIRVHLAAIGHPLSVDRVYGKRNGFLLSSIKRSYKKKEEKEELPIMRRQTLHAWKLILPAGLHDSLTEITCDPSKDFQIMLKQLRKCNNSRTFEIPGV